MKQLKLFQGTGISPASAKLITAYRIALVRDRPLSLQDERYYSFADNGIIKSLYDSIRNP